MDNCKRKMVHRGLTYEEKLMKRKMNNRISAQIARDRKKIFIKELESKVMLLENQKKALAEENYKLYQVLSTLKLQKKLNELTNETQKEHKKYKYEYDQFQTTAMQPAMEVEIKASDQNDNKFNDQMHLLLPSPPNSPIKSDFLGEDGLDNQSIQEEYYWTNEKLSDNLLRHSFKNPAVISEIIPLQREKMMQKRMARSQVLGKILKKSPFMLMMWFMIMMMTLNITNATMINTNLLTASHLCKPQIANNIQNQELQLLKRNPQISMRRVCLMIFLQIIFPKIIQEKSSSNLMTWNWMKKT